MTEIARLRDRVEVLETLLGLRTRFPPSLGLTRKEERVLGVIVDRVVATNDALMYALFGDDPDGDGNPQNIRVHVMNIRRKLPRGVTIHTRWGTGYFLDDDSRAELSELISSAGDRDPGVTAPGHAPG